MKSFINDLYDYDCTEEQAENNEEESGDDEEIKRELKGERSATNKNNKNAIEIDYPLLFQIVLDLNKKNFFINNFP